MVIVEIAGGEACQGLAVERIRGGRSGLDDVALVKLELDFTGHIFLCGGDKCFHCVAERGVPFALVYDMSELVAHILFHFHGSTVKYQLLELLMCFHQNGSARSLIDTAGLHADNTVLHDVDDADAVFAAETVQLTDNIGNLHLLAVDGGRNTFLEGHGHILALLRSFFRGDAEYQKVIVVRLTGRILELKTLVADMPDVAVTAVAGVCGERKMNAVCLAVCDLILAGLHGPLVVSPCSDNLEIRSESLDGKLKTDLVVSFSGSAVADGGSTFFSCDLNQLLAD